MFLYDIREYVKVYHEFIPIESCKILIDKIEEQDWREHSYANLEGNVTYRNKKEFLITQANFPEMAEFNSAIKWMISKYVYQDLKWMNAWFNAWQDFTPIRFNKYVEGTLMNVHCDHITTIFDGTRKGIPTLTVLGTLNDDFEGGDFLMWDNEKIELPTGSLIIFPSNFMFPHSVTPITKGTRYSYVTWVW